ncbi:MAG: 6-phosphogluconate dehydrogenase-like protein [Actinomycetia bacterium]|nr:6-phosphogluconate dehydrogenase-like protein [Actinomycetes bacterium]
MKLGMIGLGRMGGNMSERLRQAEHEVVGYDRDPKVSQAADLADLVKQLGDTPRVVWVMVPSGQPTDDTILELRDLLGPGDVVIDGGNSNWRDSQRHGEELAAAGIGFIDAGTSGGVWGLQEGYCLMVGGAPEHVALVQPIFDALAPVDGFAHVGPVGAGHFTKMVHNGIEYGIMQSYAEGYELLTAVDIEVDAQAAIKAWQHGSVVRSWLLDLLVLALEDQESFQKFKGYASDSGEGRWTVNEAVRLAVPLPVITAALFARFASRQEESPAMQVISALRSQFGGHSEQAIERRPAESVAGPDEGKVVPG